MCCRPLNQVVELLPNFNLRLLTFPSQRIRANCFTNVGCVCIAPFATVGSRLKLI
jgi:hypothetical protein